MIINIDDYNINYIDVGTGENILILHGWGANIKTLKPIIDLLKSKYRVLALDYPGFGESDNLKKSFSVDDYVNIVISFLYKLNIKKVILIGHSYGGRIILKLNYRSDLEFEILKNVLIDSAGIKNRLNMLIKLKICIYKILKNILKILPLNLNTKYKFEQKLKSKFGSSDYKNANKYLQETLVKSVNEDLTYCLKKMKETLIIWGNKDNSTPIWMAETMNKYINNSGLVVLNGGHYSYIDDYYTFAKVISSYFDL